MLYQFTTPILSLSSTTCPQTALPLCKVLLHSGVGGILNFPSSINFVQMFISENRFVWGNWRPFFTHLSPIFHPRPHCCCMKCSFNSHCSSFQQVKASRISNCNNHPEIFLLVFCLAFQHIIKRHSHELSPLFAIYKSNLLINETEILTHYFVCHLNCIIINTQYGFESVRKTFSRLPMGGLS